MSFLRSKSTRPVPQKGKSTNQSLLLSNDRAAARKQQRTASFLSLGTGGATASQSKARRTLIEAESPRRLLFRRNPIKKGKNVSDDIVVASLRRRLWQALTENDGTMALRCWTAFREDWEHWDEHTYNDDVAHAVLSGAMDATAFFTPNDRLSVTASYDVDATADDPTSQRKRRKNPFRKKPARVDTDDESLQFLTSPLHQAARLGDTALMEVFAASARDWDIRDGHCRTLIHCVLAGDLIDAPPRTTLAETKRMAGVKAPVADDEDRLAVVQMCIDNGVSVHAVDSTGRTALHYAALRGMATACESLLSCSYDNAMLTVIDTMGQTPCELAAKAGHAKLAANLEARALLYRDAYGTEEVMVIPGGRVSSAPPFNWCETDDAASHRRTTINLCSTNVKKIVGVTMAREITIADIEGADPTPSEKPNTKNPSAGRLIGLHSYHMERLLTQYNMSTKAVSDAVFDDPFKALEQAGLSPPPEPGEETKCDIDSTCLICCDTFDDDPTGLKSIEGCSHVFCLNCWKDYLADCVRNKSSGAMVKCPHHDCKALLSPTELEDLAGNEMHEQLIACSVDLFVKNNPNYRFCPHRGCGRPVQFINRSSDPDDIMHLMGAVCTQQNNVNAQTKTYEGVPYPQYNDLTQSQPLPRAHRFCFSCNATSIHWPIRCNRLQEWKQAIVDHVGEQEEETPFQDVAQKLWMKANTRECPKCKAPIQKNEGCNHMSCPSCKHEFCWICRKEWKLHNTETGGFFLCNRWADEKDHEYYEDSDSPPAPAAPPPRREENGEPLVLEVTYGTAMHETRAARYRSSKMDRFLHHYQRWTAHRESAALESHMMETAHTRLEPVMKEAIAFAGTDFLFNGHGLSFVYSAFTELLECRSMLQHSFAFSFLRYASSKKNRYRISSRLRREKSRFEVLQAELELLTEQVSDVVARAHLRATLIQIVYLTKGAGQKRLEFTHFMAKVLAEEQEEENEPSSRVDDTVSLDEQLEDLFPALRRNFGDDGGFGEEHSEMLIREGLRNMLRRNGLESVFREDNALITDLDEDSDVQDWACTSCTYVNSGGRRCTLCFTRRDAAVLQLAL